MFRPIDDVVAAEAEFYNVRWSARETDEESQYLDGVHAALRWVLDGDIPIEDLRFGRNGLLDT